MVVRGCTLLGKTSRFLVLDQPHKRAVRLHLISNLLTIATYHWRTRVTVSTAAKQREAHACVG